MIHTVTPAVVTRLSSHTPAAPAANNAPMDWKSSTVSTSATSSSLGRGPNSARSCAAVKLTVRGRLSCSQSTVKVEETSTTRTRPSR